LNDGGRPGDIEAPMKRQKTGVATVDPTFVLKTTAGGIPAIKWISPDTLLASGNVDHQLKVFDMNKQSI
jgi:WD40 repeat protein